MERKLNKKKVAIAILIFFLIITTIVLTILYNNNTYVRSFLDEYLFRKNVTENTLPKITTENGHTYAFNDYIVCLEKNVLTFYNKSADKVASIDIEISDPIFESNGKYLCIAEKNGGKVYLISNKNVLWQKNIEGSISNFSINKNGYVALTIADTTYKNLCKVYTDSGSELFTSYLSKSYIIDSSISNDNKFLALAETNFSGITIQSNIKIISIDKALTSSTDTIQYNHIAPANDLIVNIQYCNNNNLVCLYDNHIDIIKDTSCNEISNFNNANILFADINEQLIQIEKRNTGLLTSDFELQIINVNTLDKKIYAIDKEPKSIEISDEVTAINFGTEILFINNSGWLLKHYTSSQEVLSIVLSNDLAGIIFKDKIEFLSL